MLDRSRTQDPQDEPRIGIALAGGGPLGIVYEIGAVHAIEESLEGIHLHDLFVYVGVSAGSVIASALANGISPAQMCRIFVQNESAAFPINPEKFLQPAFREYVGRFGKLPGLLQDTFKRLVRLPGGHNVLQELGGLAAVLPAGIFSNDAIHDFLSDVFSSRGRSNDFRELKRLLYVIATHLDTGESIRFGAPGFDHVPISRAVQASAALPGFYPPVEIDNDYYVDGALRKTLHASVALDEGVELLFCVNPIVPVDARLAGSDVYASHEKLVEGGLPMVLSQTFRALVHSRMQVGMAQYREKYPQQNVVLFEPDASDARMFFTNVFSFANRHRVCEHAYQTTRRDLLARRAELEPIFERYGIRLRMDRLRRSDLHFDTNLQVTDDDDRLGMRRNPVTNRLSETLDELESWLDIRDSERSAD